MRDIKFRAWGKSGVMRGWDDLQKLHIHTLFKMSRPEVILMQYTGLKDKKGVEIYEGDIVEITFEDGVKDNMQVVFDKARFYMKGCGFWSFGGSDTTLQVIGNIYESPDLMERKQ